MSTRCQVQVIDRERRKITLYHHHDGYPSYMVPTIHAAYQLIKGMGLNSSSLSGAVSGLCFVDPAEFEVEDGHELHGDIRFYYRIYCSPLEKSDKHPVDRWELEVFQREYPEPPERGGSIPILKCYNGEEGWDLDGHKKPVEDYLRVFHLNESTKDRIVASLKKGSEAASNIKVTSIKDMLKAAARLKK